MAEHWSWSLQCVECALIRSLDLQAWLGAVLLLKENAIVCYFGASIDVGLLPAELYFGLATAFHLDSVRLRDTLNWRLDCSRIFAYLVNFRFHIQYGVWIKYSDRILGCLRAEPRETNGRPVSLSLSIVHKRHINSK